LQVPRFVTKFDSSLTFLQGLSRFLHGRDIPGVGVLPTGKTATFVAEHLRGQVGSFTYAMSGRVSAISASSLQKIRAEEISRAVVSLYPSHSYPVIMIGSANGAAVHLGAALSIPLLPQTYLITVRHSYFDPDNPQMHLATFRSCYFLCQ